VRPRALSAGHRRPPGPRSPDSRRAPRLPPRHGPAPASPPPPPPPPPPTPTPRCIAWGPDEAGINGVYLGKDVPVQAGKMLEAVIGAATPKIMTWGQYAAAGVTIAGRYLGYDWPR
jgi:hypothetical protein